MKTQLLDSAHGWEDEDTIVLEQYWIVDDEDIARITVCYSNSGAAYSEAELLVPETDATSEESLLRLRAFPSQWWQKIDISFNDGPVDTPPELLVGVANSLLERFVALCETLKS